MKAVILASCLLLPLQAIAANSAQDLAKLKARVMSADYRSDLDELRRLRDQLAQWPNDSDLAYLARYWGGFASWRIAINGANHGMKGTDLATNLKNAAADFYTSIRLKADFADAYSAASMVNGWLGVFTMSSDPAATNERFSLSRALFSGASALDPVNPRVLWAKGSFILFAPNGDPAKAIEVYRQMVKEAERRGVDPDSPLPDWGKPEALMSLAYAHVTQTPPDIDAAREEASAALKVAPEWSYVRENLIPQIEAKAREKR